MWSLRGGKVIHLELDETSGEFTTFTLPATSDPDFFTHGRWNLRVVGGRDNGDAMRLARIVDDSEGLEVLRCVLGGGGNDVMVERRGNVFDLVSSIKVWPSNPAWWFLETAELVRGGLTV